MLSASLAILEEELLVRLRVKEHECLVSVLCALSVLGFHLPCVLARVVLLAGCPT